MANDLSQDLLEAKVGQRFDTTFGKNPAQLHCVETTNNGTQFVRFLIMVFGVQAGEVCIERLQDGKLVFETLS